ncbi:MAG: potassium channel protein [Clostridia bacterium]|nr:potassium channel protein [Clostridia bacterium]
MNNRRKFAIIITFFISILIVGVLGYMVLLNVSFTDALYMTVITISTVGYGEVGEMTDAAKLFSIGIIFSGLTVVGYGATSMVSLFFEGELKDAWRRKRMEEKIHNLTEHYIVCGAGDIGTTVINCLTKNSANFVVVEENEKKVEELSESGILAILGDATHEEVLKRAGIEQAKGIVCALSTDAENVFTVLTARQMHHDIYIISKAIDQSAHNKLLKAGANKTISPNEIGGQRMAALMIRPSIMSFLDVITHAGDVTLDLEEVLITGSSSFVGKTLSEAKIPDRTGLIVLALNKNGVEHFKFNPNSSETLNEGDIMIVLGTNDQVNRLKAIVNM